MRISLARLQGNNPNPRFLICRGPLRERKMKMLVTAIAVAFSLLGLQAFAQNSTQDFVNKVAISDMFEIQSSKLAAQKGNLCCTRLTS